MGLKESSRNISRRSLAKATDWLSCLYLSRPCRALAANYQYDAALNQGPSASMLLSRTDPRPTQWRFRLRCVNNGTTALADRRGQLIVVDISLTEPVGDQY
jgi:hypothetical protein